MKRFVIGIVAAVAAGLFSQGAVAQTQWVWPLPADQPGVAVPCSNCPDTILNKPTYPYSDPLRFTGRYLSGAFANVQQQPFRTGRAFLVIPSRKANRIYMKIGSAVAIYNPDTFFSRLKSRETLTLATALPVTNSWYVAKRGSVESFLKFDKWFYAETAQSSWWTAVIDGDDRLASIDSDDRGYVYMSTAVFGWGILKDDGTNDGAFLPSTYQSPVSPASNEVSDPTTVSVVKSGTGRYYAFVGGGLSVSNVYDVTDDPRQPVRRMDFPYVFYNPARADDRVAFIARDGKLYMYSVDGMVGGQSALNVYSPPMNGILASVTTDGTNFYALAMEADRSLSLTRYTPDATRSRYTATAVYATGKFGPPLSPVRYDSGYVAFAYNDASVSYDVALLRLTDSGLSEVPLGHYFHNYYLGTQGYVAPRSSLADATPYVQNGTLYLIVAATGLGDVYEVRTSDNLTLAKNEWNATNNKWSLETGATAAKRGTVNLNAPVRTDSTVYYGDTARFAAASSATITQTFQWDFGNPQAATGADPNRPTTVTQPGAGGQTAIADHQFSGIAKPACSTPPCSLAPFTINVAGVAPSTAAASPVSVTVTPPQARMGITNGTTTFKHIDVKYLLALPNASAPAPIVKGDWFFDASDGDVEGHYDTWSFTDNGVARSPLSTVPYSSNAAAFQAPVGDCGAHSLTFAAHYGPYQNFQTLGNAGYTETLGAFNYVVQASAAAVDPSHPADASGNPVFHSISRIASLDTGALTADQLAKLNWQWDLVDANENVVSAGPKGTGLPVQDWPLNKALVTADGLRVRLALYLPPDLTAPCGGARDPLFNNGQTSKSFSTPLNRPDAQLTGSCTQSGPCHFEVTSTHGTDMTADHWHYAWSTTPAASNSASDRATFDPVFTQVGTYHVKVSAVVTNDVGSTPVSAELDYTKAASNCPSMTLDNAYPVVANFACPANVCPGGQPITFAVQTTGWSLSCGDHAYSWNFGDNSTSTDASPQHSFAASSTPYTVGLTITDSSSGQQLQTVPLTIQVSGGGTGGGGTGGGGTGGGGTCGTLNDNTVYPVVASLGVCPANVCPGYQTITFAVQTNGYNLGCATHTFTWDFGDGTIVSGSSSAQHAFAPRTTPYQVKVTIWNGTQSFATMPLNVTVTGTTTGGGCQPMTANNLYPVLQSLGQCPAGVCPPNQPIGFTVQTNGYDFGCASHTFTWDFGDGALVPSSSPSIQHSFAPRTTPYAVKVTIVNSGPSFTTMPLSIQVNGTSTNECPTMTDNNLYPVVTPASLCPAGVCPASQPITFTIQTSGYTFTCLTHTFTWDFGDGVPVDGTDTIPHSFAPRTAPYLVKVTIKNSRQTFTTLPLTITAKGSGNPATQVTKVTMTTEALSAVGAYRFTPAVDPKGDGINFHWEVRVGTNVIETADKVGPVAFEPQAGFTVGTTYIITVTVDNGPTASTSIMPAPPRRRASHR